MKEIEEGSRCDKCINKEVPHGSSETDAQPCKRCEIGKGARIRLMGFWNYMHAKDGMNTKFLNHNNFKCVVEMETVMFTHSEASEDEVDDEDDEDYDGEEEDEDEES